jgi:putative flippase GtrA
MDEANSQGGKPEVRSGPLPHAAPAWFLAVGVTATLVHWAVVVSLVEGTAAQPLSSNVVGWVAAVSVSFVGHHKLSFRGHGAPVAAAAWRFLLVSGAGFSVNQAAYAVLLSLTSKSYALLLGAVLAVVAVATYVASRWWVFTRRSRA